MNLDFDSLIINVIDGYTSEIILIVIIFTLLLISVTVVLLLISRREVRRPINLAAFPYRIETHFLSFPQYISRGTTANSGNFGTRDHWSHGFVFDSALRGTETRFFASSV